MTTYSQLVDAMILETRRPDLASEIHSYVNQTIRELHFTPDANTALHYAENFREVQLIADTKTGFVWDQLFPDRFQTMAVARFSSVFDVNQSPIFANPRTPGRGMKPEERSYYRSGNSFVFQNYGGLGGVIDLGYYEYPRRLKYFAPGPARLATYDSETGWAYDVSVIGLPAQEAAREQATNWILFRWEEIVREGIRAKVYKRNGDDGRARTAYSAFTAMRRNLESSELSELDGVY